MAALNFPDPNVQTSYTNPDTGISYEWSNGVWKAVSTAQTAPELFVDVSGDNMTGNLTLGTDKIVLNASTGESTFAGETNIGGFNGSSNTTDGVVLGSVGGVYSQLAAATAGTGVVFQGMHGNSFTSRVTADGSATFASRLSPGTSSLNDHALVASNNNAANATLIAQNYNDSGLLLKGYNSSNETVTINADGSATFANFVTTDSYFWSKNSSNAVAGCYLYNWTSSTRTDAALKISNTSNEGGTTIDLNYDGSAEFAGTASATKFYADQFEGTASGGISIRAKDTDTPDTDTDVCLEIYSKNTGGIFNAARTRILANGNATFVGDINGGSNQNATVNGSGSTLGLEGYLKLFHSTTETHPWLQCYKNDGAGSFTKNIEFFDDGSALFAGNMGLGTTSPSNALHIKNDFPAIRLESSESSYVGRNTIGQFQNGLYIECDNDNAIANSFTAFTVDGSERMRIDSSGSLLVGRTGAYNASPGEVAAFQGDKHGVVIYQSANANYTCLNLRNSYANNSGNNVSGNMITFHDQGGSERGKIAMNGSSTSYITSSDYRLKENVVDINDGITRVKQLQPKRFNFIVDADTTVDGFLAHEAQTVVPEAVTGVKDGEEVQGIDQSKLVPLLTAALQEAITKIETLEQRLSDAGIA